MQAFGVSLYPQGDKCVPAFGVQIISPVPIVSAEAEWQAFRPDGQTMASGKEMLGGQADGITWFAFGRIADHFPPGSRIEWKVTATNALPATKTEDAPVYVFGAGCQPP
jgi:hypothetical protein